MATIRYLDAQGSTLPLDLVGDSGMLPLRERSQVEARYWLKSTLIASEVSNG